MYNLPKLQFFTSNFSIPILLQKDQDRFQHAHFVDSFLILLNVQLFKNYYTKFHGISYSRQLQLLLTVQKILFLNFLVFLLIFGLGLNNIIITFNQFNPFPFVNIMQLIFLFQELHEILSLSRNHPLERDVTPSYIYSIIHLHLLVPRQHRIKVFFSNQNHLRKLTIYQYSYFILYFFELSQTLFLFFLFRQLYFIKFYIFQIFNCNELIIYYKMKNIVGIGYYFCASKNYTSTFKLRSRLSQFFKHVHPDQLTQAPTKVKQQNLRSLTNFNSYIDSISHSRPIQAKVLRFYIAEKTNLKSKKFFSFSVELPQISAQQSNLSEQKAKKLIDNIVEVLNKKFLQSKNIRKQGKGQEKPQKIGDFKIQEEQQTQSQRFSRLSSKIKPFDKKSYQNQQQAQILKSALNTKYMQAQKQSLSTKLKKSISFADTGSNKSVMWSRIASNDSGLYKDYQRIMDELIDPRLIYFDQTLSINEIQQFKKRLLPGNMDLPSYKASKIIVQLCAKMQSFDPPICFYVSKKYSSTQIPGFMTIPYNFVAIQLAQYFQKQIDTIIQQQQKFQQFYDYYKDLHTQLLSQNNLLLDETNFKNNKDIWQRVLMVKRLQRFKYENVDGNSKVLGVVAFDQETFDLFKKKYEIKNSINDTAIFYNNKVIIRVDFVDSDIEKIFKKLNRTQEEEIKQNNK